MGQKACESHVLGRIAKTQISSHNQARTSDRHDSNRSRDSIDDAPTRPIPGDEWSITSRQEECSPCEQQPSIGRELHAREIRIEGSVSERSPAHPVPGCDAISRNAAY